MDKLSDQQARAKQRERSDFVRELMTEHYSLVLSVALARLRDRDAAEDLTQEVFLRALVHLDSSRNAQQRLAWLVCVARNLANDWARRNQSASNVIRQLTQLDSTRSGQSTSIEQNPRERLMQNEEAIALENALESLSDEQREMVLMHYMGGHSRREIAAKLQVHPATVGRHLDAALAQLKNALEPALRRHFGKVKPGAAALARAGAVIAAWSALAETSRGALLGTAAWKQGEAAAFEALHTAGMSAAKTGFERSAGPGIVNAAAASIKGAWVMGKGKVLGGILAVAALSGTATVVLRDDTAAISASRPAANAAAVGDWAEVPLPALPSGWDFTVKPSKQTPATWNVFAGAPMDRYAAAGIDISFAAALWKSQVREIDPALAEGAERYDIVLTAPAMVDENQMKEILRVEIQRLFHFRAKLETRMTPSLVLRSPGGRPASFKPATRQPSSILEKNFVKIRSFDMPLLVEYLQGGRTMPVFDETGITGKFDVDLPAPGNDWYTAWTDASFAKIGLQVAHENREAMVLIIKPGK